MKRYAMIKDRIVENICLWDGNVRSDENPSAWEPPQDYELVDVEDIFCSIGWLWDGNVFVNPNPPSEIDEVVE